MVFPKPDHSRSKVDRAGEVLCKNESNHFVSGESFLEWLDATEVLGNWRSCHGYPINTFQATLRTKLQKIDPDAIVAQRLKRISSIVSKLSSSKSMRLSRMQDIGGLRAVVRNLQSVRSLSESYRQSKFKHELVSEKDYISFPKNSGYRGIHLVYRYKNAKAPEYDGLRLELQIRTRVQHAWATAVETMGTFLNQALKSSKGPEEWLAFFALAGSAFARLENTCPVSQYSHLNAKDTYRACTQAASDLRVHVRLDAFAHAVNVLADRKSTGDTYHLIVLDPLARTVTLHSFGRDRLEEANSMYTATEREIAEGANKQAVLVSAGTVDQLRRAYPNYFLDTREFLKQLRKIESLGKSKG